MALPSQIIDEMQISTQSAKSLIYLAIMLLVVGGAVGVPVAGVLAFGLAFLCAALPALFGVGHVRIVAGAIALLAAFAATATYLGGDPAYDAYLERGRTTAPGAP